MRKRENDHHCVAEILYPELEEYGELAGNLLQENYRAALTTDFYTMKAGEQTFVPDLTFHGYRYIEITGLDEALPAENLKSLVISSIDNTAAYDSSNELVNRLFLNGQNSEASNYITLPTDCPQRNERMGWMGDANVYALAGSYNADTYQFLRQWLNCVRESQGEDGMTSHTSPNYPSYDAETGSVEVGGMSFGITWNSAIVFIPYYLYQQYGDTTIIDENIDAIYKYMENLEKNPLTYGGRCADYRNSAYLTDRFPLRSSFRGNYRRLNAWKCNVYVLSGRSFADGRGHWPDREKQKNIRPCMRQRRRHGIRFTLMKKPEKAVRQMERSFIRRLPMHLR